MIVVCMPVRDSLEPETEYAVRNHLPPCRVLTERGLPVDVARNRLAKAARESDAEHIVWIDSDMFFAADAVSNLIEVLDDADVAVAHFCVRMAYQRAVAYRGEVGAKLKQLNLGIDYEIGNTVAIDSSGFGLVAHRRELLDRLGDDPFAVDGNSYEDYAFFRRVRKIGGRVLMHTGIPVAHVEGGEAFLPGLPTGRITNGRLEVIDDKRLSNLRGEQSLRTYSPAIDEYHLRKLKTDRGAA